MKSLHPISFTSWKDALNRNVRDRYFRHRYDDSHKNATILSTKYVQVCTTPQMSPGGWLRLSPFFIAIQKKLKKKYMAAYFTGTPLA